MDGAASETSRSLGHVAAVIRRWWLLITIGTLLALSFGAAVSIGTKSHYVAEAQVLVNQPAQTLQPGDDTALHRISELQATIARFASSDSVLGSLQSRGTTSRTLDDLRTRVSASAVPNTLLLTVRADFPTSEEAERVEVAVIEQMGKKLTEFSGGTSNPTVNLVLEPVQAPSVTKVSGSPVRTTAIALLLGFGFSMLAAFALDRG